VRKLDFSSLCSEKEKVLYGDHFHSSVYLLVALPSLCDLVTATVVYMKFGIGNLSGRLVCKFRENKRIKSYFESKGVNAFLPVLHGFLMPSG